MLLKCIQTQELEKNEIKMKQHFNLKKKILFPYTSVDHFVKSLGCVHSQQPGRKGLVYVREQDMIAYWDSARPLSYFASRAVLFLIEKV